VFEERAFPDPAKPDPDDSGETLSRVRQWISDHRQVPFFCLVRICAVAALPPEGAPIEEVFGASGSAARDVDRFDSALLRLDRQLGALFKYIRDYETRSNTAIVVTSTYGLEFSPSATRRIAEERSEMVPLIIETPERRQLKYPNEAKLHDLAPTLARLAGVRLPGVSSESSLLP
jgi:membrane-anchored protein YejM (alkaline phosphatase superfamily)